ncbi:MAG TPA: 50S ribosomal protein L19 [bacterium]|nr:50S ribosomal protein L19 [bacterium]HEX67967.1 50S ribosomal protein L19 [bacterium]
MKVIEALEKEKMKKDIPEFSVGDTVRVYVKFYEGGKERIQPFEGIVIRKRGSGIRQTFTVRRTSFGEGVERIFPLHSPVIEKIEVLRKGKVRRAKLYYLRSKRGKKLRVKEKS